MFCRLRPSLIAVALALCSTALAGTQAQPPVAIVGARIVDGSGNEPFVGTVVVEGDRIRAVGRSVEVPAGAVTVDGTGRTVLPGLIDVVLVLDGAAAATPAAAIAAALYGGVTTVGLAGVPDAQIDGLRADGGRVDTGSRVAAIGAVSPAGAASASAPAEWARVFRTRPSAVLLAADGEGAAAIAADARSRGVRVIVDAGASGTGALALEPHLVVGAVGGGEAAALVAQNVTVAPDLLAFAPAAVLGAGTAPSELAPLQDRHAASEVAAEAAGRWNAGTGSVKALREGRVRLAVASRAGTNRLIPGLSTHAAVRLLVEAGLTPLQAVTAATSGGAWALGLQSDRGFLAPGMRADLVLVHGDPTTTIADLGRVERVWLGGVAVDRPLLLTKVPAREVAAPTATAAPGPAPPAAETNPTTAAAATRTPPAGRAGRRRRADAKGDVAPPVAPTATPPLPAPAAEAAPPTAAATAVTATPAPATPEAATPEPAMPAPVTPTPGAAPPVGTATPIAAAAAPVRLDAPLIDDFERGDDRSAAGPAWASGSSEGTTPATLVMGRVVRGLRDHALHLTARMGDGRAPFARAAIALTSDGRPVDASRFKGIRFEARGEGRYRIVFVTRGASDGRYYESYFSGSPVWTPVGIPFASIGQNGKGSHASFTGRDVVEIRFEIARDPGRMGWLELDNVKFY